MSFLTSLIRWSCIKCFASIRLFFVDSIYLLKYWFSAKLCSRTLSFSCRSCMDFFRSSFNFLNSKYLTDNFPSSETNEKLGSAKDYCSTCDFRLYTWYSNSSFSISNVPTMDLVLVINFPMIVSLELLSLTLQFEHELDELFSTSF